MPDRNKVRWYEGMALRVQHFQQQDRYHEQLLRDRCEALSAYGWGVLIQEIDQEALNNEGQLALSRCRGVMRDGTPFDMPDADALPEPAVIAPEIQDAQVYLALSRSAERDEMAAPGDTAGTTRFRVQEVAVRDCNVTDAPREETLWLARYRYRLLVEGQDNLAGYTTMPLARVRGKRGERTVELDSGYIPPCLDCNAAPALQDWLGDIRRLLAQCSRDLAGRVSGVQLSQGALENLLLLQTANRYRLLFEHFSRHRLLHPERFFQVALQLLGDLSALAHDARLPTIDPVYDHDDLRTCFPPVIDELRRLLPFRPDEQVHEIPVETHADGRFLARQEHFRHLLERAEFILVVWIPENMRRHFPGICVVCAAAELEDLRVAGDIGIRLVELAAVPPNLKFETGASYFKLTRDDRYWPRLASDRWGMGFYVPNLKTQFPHFRMRLFALKNES